MTTRRPSAAPNPIPGRRTHRPRVRTLPTCHYCDMPAARCEYDHFPVPQRHGGTEIVPACINCHELKDRVSVEAAVAAAGAAPADPAQPRRAYDSLVADGLLVEFEGSVRLP